MSTGKITSTMITQLKRKVFQDVPHNILTRFPDFVVKSLPEEFIKQLPKAPAGVIKVTLHKSPSHAIPEIKGTIKALGLEKRFHSIYHKNTPEVRGMIHKANRYVRVEEIPINN
ncbi:hypothetical protein CYY_008209 [Polysphondylium violaceum]|uniref:Large ribosomal subunit protein uL30m n=1 Tax=Polysphondylium violaceum TaxID=133409 RepID=A0A8J4UXG8_9MYCE|nr:hypothetical protein CYY_008209 [Polysphondylium violaceum]